jgi:transcriptional antiterminator RfaH
MPSWLVARTMPSREDTVKTRLERIGTISYFPRFLATLSDRRTHRRRKVVKPLFPCYLFVKSETRFYFLKDIDDVTSVVLTLDGEPARSERLDLAIEQMMTREAAEGPLEFSEREPQLKFRVGERVRVLSGAFVSLLGVCSEVTLDQRFAVLLEMLGRKVRVVYSDEELAAA